MYSWPHTAQLIETQLSQVQELKESIRHALTSSRPGPCIDCEILLDAFRKLKQAQETVDQHVRYNAFWQSAIDRDRSYFDARTRLLDALLKIQSSGGSVAREGPVSGGDPQELKQQINDRESIHPPLYVKASRSGARWLITVPIYTDIRDGDFLDRFEQAGERIWKSEDGKFQLDITVKSVDVAALYRPDRGPALGEKLDLEAHVGRFPADGAVLTTGARSTFASLGRFVVLGPGEISTHVLAHELGHLLGFEDEYIRGYRDLGADGFEVLELIVDRQSLMSVPGSGRVLRRHFERLLEKIAVRE
ncbi:MAG: hypothetical protein HY645_07510 [Acidobacteria bacterium]|nr:hypothetical protein [Acidobacteriota bacterium]